MALLVWRSVFASFEVQSKFSGGFKKLSSRSGVKNIEALRLGFVRLFHHIFFFSDWQLTFNHIYM